MNDMLGYDVEVMDVISIIDRDCHLTTALIVSIKDELPIIIEFLEDGTLKPKNLSYVYKFNYIKLHKIPDHHLDEIYNYVRSRFLYE